MILNVRKLNKIVLLFVTLSVFMFMDCWYYSFSGKSLPGIESVAIPLFDLRNNANEVEIRDKLQNSLVSKFQNENILKVVSRNQADSILEGVIENIEDNPTAINIQEQAQQWELKITVQFKLEVTKSGKVIVNEKVVGMGLYTDLQQRDQAVEDAVKQLIQDISDKIVSGWN
ncbi:LPS assembly lipoprotein LptE [candidate division KSB1 bacterium]